MKDVVRQKKQAHELLERLSVKQVSAVVGLIEARLDPVSRALANAPEDDEPEFDSERRAVAESKNCVPENEAIPNDEVLAPESQERRISNS